MLSSTCPADQRSALRSTVPTRIRCLEQRSALRLRHTNDAAARRRSAAPTLTTSVTSRPPRREPGAWNLLEHGALRRRRVGRAGCASALKPSPRESLAASSIVQPSDVRHLRVAGNEPRRERRRRRRAGKRARNPPMIATGYGASVAVADRNGHMPLSAAARRTRRRCRARCGSTRSRPASSTGRGHRALGRRLERPIRMLGEETLDLRVVLLRLERAGAVDQQSTGAHDLGRRRAGSSAASRTSRRGPTP